MSQDGIFIKKQVIAKGLLMEIKTEVLRAIGVCDGKLFSENEIDRAVKDFKGVSLQRMHDLLIRKPYLRRVLPAYFRYLPSVRRLASEPAVLEGLREQGLTLPVERSVSFQLWLPWEDIFHEKLHQDVGGLVSENSWTIQVPLHDVTLETGAVEVFAGTYRHGVLPLELVKDERNGYLYETASQDMIRGMEPTVTDIEYGDAFFFRCLNLHRTSKHQSGIRWSVVIRYDDLHQAKILENGTNPYNKVVRNYDFKIWTDQLEKFLQDYHVEAKDHTLARH